MKTVAETLIDLNQFVSDRIKLEQQQQDDKTKPLHPNVVWHAVADWLALPE